MSQAGLDVRLLTCFSDPAARSRWSEMIIELKKDLQVSLAGSILGISTQDCLTLEDAQSLMSTEFGRNEAAGYVLISDGLLDLTREMRPRLTLSYAGKELSSHFARKPYVSLAVGAREQRVGDVDLVLCSHVERHRLEAALRLLVRRLQYYVKPVGREEATKCDIRELRGMNEFREALRLRFDVYQIMGYVDDSSLDECELELNWCDFVSTQFGAFVQTESGGTRLIGTARLILTKQPPKSHRLWADGILRANTSLLSIIKRQKAEIAQFRLPVFHTLPLDSELQEESNSPFPFGELSRVVVSREWRGLGLARKLVEEVLRFADRAQVAKTFLECLALHEKMYREFGFETLNQRGEVMGVGKTMVGMRRIGKSMEIDTGRESAELVSPRS